MENIGITVKRIREDKGFLSKETYEGILSRSTAYRFEKDVAKVTLKQLQDILKRLNIFSLDEFVFLRRKWHLELAQEDTLLSEYNAVNTARAHDLVGSSELTLAFYQKYKDDRRKQAKYYAYLVHIDYLITTIQFDEMLMHRLLAYEAEYQYVHQYLITSKEWTLAELEAFPIVSWAFAGPTKEVGYQRFKTNFKKYQAFYEVDIWANKYIKGLLYYFIGQIHMEDYDELVLHLDDLDQIYQEMPQLKINNVLNYSMYLFLCGIRSAYLKDMPTAQAYLVKFTNIQQAIAPDAKILQVGQQYFQKCLQKLHYFSVN